MRRTDLNLTVFVLPALSLKSSVNATGPGPSATSSRSSTKRWARLGAFRLRNPVRVETML